jgi:hypothetical protein
MNSAPKDNSNQSARATGMGQQPSLAVRMRVRAGVDAHSDAGMGTGWTEQPSLDAG